MGFIFEVVHFVASPPVKVATPYPVESTCRGAEAVAVPLHRTIRFKIPQLEHWKLP